jgi:hypothetical protein
MTRMQGPAKGGGYLAIAYSGAGAEAGVLFFFRA